ncbi:hypothetical protein ACHAXS_003092, partial [Conticribra weissflogii]
CIAFISLVNKTGDWLIHKFVKIKFDCDISPYYFTILQHNVSSLNITILHYNIPLAMYPFAMSPFYGE